MPKSDLVLARSYHVTIHNMLFATHLVKAVVVILCWATFSTLTFGQAFDISRFSGEFEYSQFGFRIAGGETTAAVAEWPAVNGTARVSTYSNRLGEWRRTQQINLGSARDGVVGDVAIDGNMMAIGYATANGGWVKIYKENGNGRWTQQAFLEGPEDEFGRAVDLSGDYVAISARNNAFVYQIDGGQLTYQASTPTPRADVSIDHDTFVVGSPATANTGNVRVFQRNNTDWNLRNEFSTPSNSDHFGGSVDVLGDTLVVGARRDGDGQNSIGGSAYVYQREDVGGDWEFRQNLTPNVEQNFSEFGAAVAVGPNGILIGAPYYQGQGSGILFQQEDDDRWRQVAEMRISDIPPSRLFGASLEMAGDHIFFGAPLDDSPSRNLTGSAYFFSPKKADLNGDWQIDGDDIDWLTQSIAAGEQSLVFDLNGDGDVDHEDTTAWLNEAGLINIGRPYRAGDSNLDGFVDVQDFNLWNTSKFSDEVRWTRGNFNADKIVDVSDFNVWNRNRNIDVISVPEPQLPLALLIFGLCVADRTKE